MGMPEGDQNMNRYRWIASVVAWGSALVGSGSGAGAPGSTITSIVIPRGAGDAIVPRLEQRWRACSESLQELIWREGPLREILPSIMGLARLVKLELSEHELKAIPDGLGQLTLLRELDLSGNRIKKIPQSIKALCALEVFKIRNNLLGTVPSYVLDFPHLRKIYLQENRRTILVEAAASGHAFMKRGGVIYVDDEQGADFEQETARLREAGAEGLATYETQPIDEKLESCQ